MRLLVLSDLHLEHRPLWNLPDEFPDIDVAVCAGDIDESPAASIRRLAAHPALLRKPIIFVAGNHEFYGGVYEDRIAEGKSVAAETGVHYLVADTVVIDGARFVGATLWTDYSLDGNRPLALMAAERGLNDHRLIKRRAYRAGDKGRFKWLPKDAAWHHARHRAYIQDVLATPHEGPTVVVTHHAPSPKSIARQYIDDPLNPAFASDLEQLMHGPAAPELWVHGHIHASNDYMVGDTRIVANPKGYGPGPEFPRIENEAFKSDFVVDLQPRLKMA